MNLTTKTSCSALPKRCSTKAQQTWRTVRPAARSSQQHATASTLDIPESLDLIDSLFEGICEQSVHIHDATHAVEQQATFPTTPPTQSGEASAKTSSAVRRLAQVNGGVPPKVDSSTQRSKLLQRLQAKRAAVPNHTVSQPATAEVDTVDGTGTSHTQSSRSSRALPVQQQFTSASISGPQQQSLAESESITVNGDSSSKHVSSREGASTAAAASAAAGAAPRNPWLIRQQQQRKIQQQQQAARILASQQRQEQQQRRLEQERLLQRQQLQQQLRNQQQQQHAAGTATTPAAAAGIGLVQQPRTRRAQAQGQGARRQLAHSQPHPQQQQQQQQQQQPPAATYMRGQHLQEHQQQRQTDPQQQVSQPAATAPHDQATSHHHHQQQQQQPFTLLQPQQLQQAAVNLDGVVRSSRRSRPPTAVAQVAAAAISNSSHQQQQTPTRQGPNVPPAAAASAAAAAADNNDGRSNTAAVDSNGQMPLLVTGGYASGNNVVWMNKAQVQIQQPAPAAAAAARGRGDAAGSLPPHSRSSSTSKPGAKTAGSSSSNRYRRTAKSLQGVVTSPGPNLQPLAAAAAAAAPPAAAAPSVATPASAAFDVQSSSSSSSSTTTTSTGQDVQQQQLLINSSNWQHMALQRLQGVFDPQYHTSMYTLAVDAWAAALQPSAAARYRSSSSSSSVIHSDRSGNAAAAAWSISCLYSSDRYIWCSVLLALLDSLADDADLARVRLAATVLPMAVLRQLVLPAAEVLDDEVYRELLQVIAKLEGGSSSSRTGAGSAAAAVQPVIGRAPWLQQQQQQQKQQKQQKASVEVRSSSSSVSDNSSGAGANSQQIQISDQAAAAAAEDDLVPGGAELFDAILELQQLQGLYPGVELSALAHVAQLHGVWAQVLV